MIQTTCHAGLNEWALAKHAMYLLGSRSKSCKIDKLGMLGMEGIDRSLSVNHSIIHNTEKKECLKKNLKEDLIL